MRANVQAGVRLPPNDPSNVLAEEALRVEDFNTVESTAIMHLLIDYQ